MYKHWLSIFGLDKVQKKIAPASILAKKRGDALLNEGKLEDAILCYQQALKSCPRDADLHLNLGYIFSEQGLLLQARSALDEAVAINPQLADAFYLLGRISKAEGSLTVAQAHFEAAIRINPDLQNAYPELVQVLSDSGQDDLMEIILRQCVKRFGGEAHFHWLLGHFLLGRRNLQEAITHLRSAVALNSNSSQAHVSLGLALQADGTKSSLQEAVLSLRAAHSLGQRHANTYNILGNVLQVLGRHDEAIECYEAALVLQPASAEVFSNLGGAYLCRGELEAAIASYMRALEHKPDYLHAFGNMLLALNYHPDHTAKEVYSVYQTYNERFAVPLQHEWVRHNNSRDPHRRLKVGYILPAFSAGSLRHFLEPLWAHHSKQAVDVYAYSECEMSDLPTSIYRKYVDHWILSGELSDQQLTQRIREDGIDVLVDIVGQTANNRLLVFARKPAPVSVAWLMGNGYTTGLTAIDYFLTDCPSVPEGTDSYFSEMPWRLPEGCFTVYRPASGMGEISSLPALERGYVTFGTFSRAVRLNHRTIRLWAEILKREEHSRLVIDSADFSEPGVQSAFFQKFAAYGIDPSRLDIGYHSPPWDLLRGVDIVLDCFPHNSGTTLFEALYMGVPYITLAGRPSVGLLGSSILVGLGRPEWIAYGEDEYLQIALALSKDLVGLSATRVGLRAELVASTLMDEVGFTRRVEAAYRSMWMNWCTTGEQ